MKKILSAILMLSTIPAFATGVPSTETTADCDNTTLDTYTGTSNLQADWRANTIALHWYDGDTELNVPTASQSCTYDGTLTPPSTIPTKTGYTFKGWRVRPMCSFTTEELMQLRQKDFGSAPLNGDDGYNKTKYGLTTPGEWVGEFGKWVVESGTETFEFVGTLKGIAKCSAKSGNYTGMTFSNDSSNWLATESELTSASGEAKYCWCRAINYTPNGGNQCTVSSSSWVFVSAYESYPGMSGSAYCALDCAAACGFYSTDIPEFRHALLGVRQ